jgi:hypothetical protein
VTPEQVLSFTPFPKPVALQVSKIPFVTSLLLSHNLPYLERVPSICKVQL